MKKKKVLILSLLLVGILAIGSSLALLTDTASDYNTMTTGFARIDQLEYERDEDGKLIPFIQDQLLIPTTGTPSWADEYQKWEEVGAEGSNQLFADSFTNVKDKFVFVKNTGLVNVYYRTIIAVEAPEGTDITVGNTVYPAIMPNVNGNERFDWDFVQLDGETEETEGLYIYVDGVRYYVMVANYLHELTPGEVSRPSLLQVYMRKEVTNEMIAKFGPEVDILVFSQAVQSKGYTDARTALVEGFGEISEKNHPWLTAQNQTAEAVNGVVEVTDDYYLVNIPFYSNTTATEPVTINGNGHLIHRTVTSEKDNFNWDSTKMIPTTSDIFSSGNGSLVTVNDLTFTGTTQSIMLGNYKSSNQGMHNTVLNNVDVIGLEVVSFSAEVAPAVTVYGTATLNNTNIYGTRRSIQETTPLWPVYDLVLVNHSNTTINGGKIGSIATWCKAKLAIYGAEVDMIEASATQSYGITIGNGTTVNLIDVFDVKNDHRGTTVPKIVIEAGATVKTLDLTGVTDYSHISIDKDANVEKIIAADGSTMTLNDWLNK